MISRLTGLWRHPDFLLFWTGQTIYALIALIGAAMLILQRQH